MSEWTAGLERERQEKQRVSTQEPGMNMPLCKTQCDSHRRVQDTGDIALDTATPPYTVHWKSERVSKGKRGRMLGGRGVPRTVVRETSVKSRGSGNQGRAGKPWQVQAHTGLSRVTGTADGEDREDRP